MVLRIQRLEGNSADQDEVAQCMSCLIRICAVVEIQQFSLFGAKRAKKANASSLTGRGLSPSGHCHKQVPPEKQYLQAAGDMKLASQKK